jgi:hypothetical protein
MKEKAQKTKWVAIKILRGFPVEARGFKTKSEAELQERKWRRTLNPDYDESGVLPLQIAY